MAAASVLRPGSHESGGGTMLSSGTVRMRPKEVLQAIYYFDHGGQHEEVSVLQSGRRSAAKSAKACSKGKVADGQQSQRDHQRRGTQDLHAKAFAKMSQKISFRSCGGQLCGNWQRGAVHRTRRQVRPARRSRRNRHVTRTTYRRIENVKMTNARSVTWES